MAQAGINIQVSIKEMYELCCNKCQKKIRALVKDKITDDMVSKVIG